MNKAYQISGKSTTLKNYANVHDTIAAIKRIVNENYPAVEELADYLQGRNDEETFQKIWNYVRNTIKYQNDKKGTEQLRTPQRTRHDKIGDCDDMSILISAILKNFGYDHELIVAAYKKKDKWQHIYPVAYDKQGNRFVIDCVPEIPYFNYEAKPIKNKIIINMKLEELGVISDSEMISELTEPFDINSLEGIANDDDEISLVQGLLGNVAIVDEDEEYDTVLSGSELKRNIIIKQLVDAKQALETELKNPSELSQLNDNRTELQLINNIIANFDNEDELDEVINIAIQKGTLYQNFYKAIQYGLDDAVNGLAGDEEDDIYYLKIMDDDGLLDEMIEDDFDEDDIDGIDELGRRRKRKKRKGGFFKRLGKKIKKGIKKFKEKHPKLAKIGHALKKYSPATFAARKSLEIFIRANTFHMADKLAIGYATEAQAKKLGYSKAEWQKFVDGKNKAEKKWYGLGGKKKYFQKMITKSKAGRRAGLKGVDLGVVTAVISAVTKVFGAVIKFFKNMKLKKKDGTEVEETDSPEAPGSSEYSTKTVQTNLDVMENENTNADTHEKSGVTSETVTDDSGKETTVYKDKDGNEINKFKAFFLKNKTMIIIVSIVLVVGIVGLIIWKARQKALKGLAAAELSKRQENYIKKQGLNNRAYASLVREEIGKDGKNDNKTNRKSYYKKVFRDAFSKPISEKQRSAALNYNSMYREVRDLAKQKGGGSAAWKEAWAEVKKKSRA